MEKFEGKRRQRSRRDRKMPFEDASRDIEIIYKQNDFHKLESIRRHNHCIKAAGRMQLICDAQYVR